MDYEKKYKEALCWMRSVYPTMTGAAKEDAEHYFPELKESEDDRMVRKIVAALSYYRNEGCMSQTECDECKLWLKKQGEHSNFRNKILIGDRVTRNEDGMLVNLSQLDRVAKKHNITGIGSKNAQGKLGEMIKNLKPAIEMKSPEESLGISSKEYNEIVNECLYGEQKPADKAELKFHEGDWITNSKLLVGQITSFDGEYYRYMCDGLEQPLHISNAHKWHLWTIKDAKDGDVLADNYGIYIFNCFDSLDDKLFICKYAYNYSRKVFEVGEMLCSKTDVYPATKEQRDTLMKAMADAGYTFNFEKKELKKIEFNPDDLIEESYKQQADDLIDMVTEKSAWSEDDENRINRLIAYFEDKESFTAEDDVVYANWLESLKNRIQPKQEWNKEDHERYISCLQRLGTGNPDQPETINSKWFKEHVYPHRQWKPSEEQMDALHNIITGDIRLDLESLTELHEQLKRL